MRSALLLLALVAVALARVRAVNFFFGEMFGLGSEAAPVASSPLHYFAASLNNTCGQTGSALLSVALSRAPLMELSYSIATDGAASNSTYAARVTGVLGEERFAALLIGGAASGKRLVGQQELLQLQAGLWSVQIFTQYPDLLAGQLVQA